jgi:hypothetical protein
VIAAAAFTAASALAFAVAGAGADRPPLALSATPTRVVLAAGAWTAVRVTNAGRAPVVVDVATSAFVLDPSGRPRISGLDEADHWLVLAPRRLALGAGRSATVAVSAVVPRRARPGEHAALILFRTRPRAGAPVPIVMQVGVVVTVRVPGRVVRRLDVRGLRLVRHGRRRTFLLTIWNRGNVSEALPMRRVRVVLRRGGRLFATLLPLRRQILPHAVAVLALRYAGGVRGWVQAAVAIRHPRPGSALLRRTYRIRL